MTYANASVIWGFIGLMFLFGTGLCDYFVPVPKSRPVPNRPDVNARMSAADTEARP